MMKVGVLVALGIVFTFTKIDDVMAGVRTDQGPGPAAGEPPCQGPGTDGKTYNYGDTWTKNGHKCQCYAHGISNCDAMPSDDD